MGSNTSNQLGWKGKDEEQQIEMKKIYLEMSPWYCCTTLSKKQTKGHKGWERESEMNRWPYQSVLCLVFNLDTEWKKNTERDWKKIWRGWERHCIHHRGRYSTVEPLASPLQRTDVLAYYTDSLKDFTCKCYKCRLTYIYVYICTVPLASVFIIRREGYCSRSVVTAQHHVNKIQGN